ncbi:acyltransferase [Paraconexibacter sp. AEG42_29]
MLKRAGAYLRGRLVKSPAWGELVQETLRLHPSVRGPRDRVLADPTAVLNGAMLNTVSGTITIGRHAFLGDDVALLTGTHDHTLTGLERQQAVPDGGRDIVVGEGAWIASRAVVLGPCTIGANAVVAAGAVVTGDVAAGAIVAGVPATPR